MSPGGVAPLSYTVRSSTASGATQLLVASSNSGWTAFLDIVPAWIWFSLKTFVFLYIFLWVRATLPRYRYDQLMRLGWKVLIPAAIGLVVVTGTWKIVVWPWLRAVL